MDPASDDSQEDELFGELAAATHLLSLADDVDAIFGGDSRTYTARD
jgi:hypothetical protein